VLLLGALTALGLDGEHALVNRDIQVLVRVDAGNLRPDDIPPVLDVLLDPHGVEVGHRGPGQPR